MGRGKETNWKLVVWGVVEMVGGWGDTFIIFVSYVCVFDGHEMFDEFTWWQSFWEEEQTVLRQGRGKRF